jgi:hypothetical protein
MGRSLGDMTVLLATEVAICHKVASRAAVTFAAPTKYPTGRQCAAGIVVKGPWLRVMGTRHLVLGQEVRPDLIGLAAALTS